MRVIELTYFKDSGKFYSEAKFHTDVESFNVGQAVRNLRDRGTLPGLANGTWDGPILATDDGFPFLIMPKEVKQKVERYDVIFPRNYDDLTDRSVIATCCSREDVIKSRRVSGDLVVHHGTNELVTDMWWLFPWEDIDPESYAHRAIMYYRERINEL